MKSKFKTNYFPNKTEKFINNKKCSGNNEYFSMMSRCNSFIYELNQYDEHDKIENRNIQNIINGRILFKVTGITIKRYKKIK
jgi:hypothetical protein